MSHEHDTSAQVTASRSLQAKKAADLERKKQRGRTAKAGIATEDATSDEQPQQAVASGTADAGNGSSVDLTEAITEPPAQPVDPDCVEAQSTAVQRQADSREGSVLTPTAAPVEQQRGSRGAGGSPVFGASSGQQAGTNAKAALPQMDGSATEGTAEQQAEASGLDETPTVLDAQSGTTSSSIYLACENSMGNGDVQEGVETAGGPAAADEPQDEIDSKYSSLWAEAGSTAGDANSVAQQVGSI